MRRWIKRIMITIVVLIAGGSAFLYWAHRQTKHVPEFYTEAMQRMPEQPAQASKELTEDVERLQAEAAREGAWQATFSDAQINAWLLEELPKKFPKMLARGVSDPRIAIRGDRMLVAAKYKDRRFDTIVSCEIVVEMTEQANMLAIHVDNLRAGALPLPMQTFLDKITKEAAKGKIDIQWDLTENGPVALVSVPSTHPKYVVNPVIVESVQLDEGNLIVAGHSGESLDTSFVPRGNVHQFVSFSPKSESTKGGESKQNDNDKKSRQMGTSVAVSIGSASGTLQSTRR